MMKDLIILGKSGNALDIIGAISDEENINSEGYTIKGYLDDNSDETDGDFLTLGSLKRVSDFLEAQFIFAIGSEKNFKLRKKLFLSLNIGKESLATVIHPSAIISNSAKIGRGAFVGAFSFIGPNVSIGENCIILSHVAISHHSSIGDFSLVAAGSKIAGRCEIGDSCYLGGGSLIKNDISVGDETLIGMGAVVVHNVSSNKIVKGNPAK